jgi:hypothetical protein
MVSGFIRKQCSHNVLLRRPRGGTDVGKQRRLLAAAAGMGRWSGGGDRGGELNGDEGEKTADIWIAAQETRTAGSLRSLITAQLDRSARIND